MNKELDLEQPKGTANNIPLEEYARLRMLGSIEGMEAAACQ